MPGTRVMSALACAAALAVAGCGGDDDPTETAIDRGLAALEGLPANGYTIGRPEAPATLTMYAQVTDLRFDTTIGEQLPDLLEGPVRRGTVKVQVRTLPGTDGPGEDDARRAASLLQAAGLQNRFWPVLVVFANRYVGAYEATDIPGVLRRAGVRDPRPIYRAQRDPRVAKAIAKAAERAREAGIVRPPAYRLTRTDGTNVDVTTPARRGELVEAVEAIVGR